MSILFTCAYLSMCMKHNITQMLLYMLTAKEINCHNENVNFLFMIEFPSLLRFTLFRNNCKSGSDQDWNFCMSENGDSMKICGFYLKLDTIMPQNL